MAYDQDPERFMGFFPDFMSGKRMGCAFVIGHLRIGYRRTVPRNPVPVRMM